MTASEIVSAIGRKSLPSMRWNVRIGTYTVMMISTANVSGRATSDGGVLDLAHHAPPRSAAARPGGA